MSKTLPALLSALVLLSAVPALAGEAEATACAASLDANGKIVFEATLPDVAGGAEVKASVKAHTKALVQAGKLTRETAKPAAQSAGACLQLLAG